MIVGIGTDVVDVERWRASVARTPGLAERVLTPAEACLVAPRQAARFAAKEALAKALGAPAGMRWHDAEVVLDDDGRPSLLVRGSVAAECERQGVQAIHVSLSHDGPVATATVVLEGEGTRRSPVR